MGLDTEDLARLKPKCGTDPVIPAIWIVANDRLARAFDAASWFGATKALHADSRSNHANCLPVVLRAVILRPQSIERTIIANSTGHRDMRDR
jgi:hypothetical protein